MSASSANVTQTHRPSLAEALRFYLFAGSAVVLGILFVVVTLLDATR